MRVETLKEVSNRVAQAMSSREEVLAAYVFGSVASGRARPDSDLDLAVLVDIDQVSMDLFRYRLRLMADLRDVLERADVEIVILNQATPVLAQNVLSKGKLIFERSRSARIHFQIRTLNEFLDTQPIRDYHLKVLKRRYGRD
jgi:predicted nucleotidyltransferase